MVDHTPAISSKDPAAENTSPEVNSAADMAGHDPADGLADASAEAATFVSWDLGDLASGPRHRGAIEWCDQTGIGGWCIATGDPTQPVDLEIFFMGARLAAVRTGDARPDVAAAVRSSACPGGFRLHWSTMAGAGIKAAVDAATPGTVAAGLRVRPVSGAIDLRFLPDVEAAFSCDAFLDLLRRLAPSDQDAPQDDRDLASGAAPSAGGEAWPDHADQAEKQGGGPAAAASGPLHVEGSAAPDEKISWPQSTMRPHASAYLVDGGWNLDGQRIKGWLNPVGREPVGLSVWCDGVVIAELDVVPAPPTSSPYHLLASFSYCLPSSLTDNRPHEIRITPAREPDWFLRHVQGDISAIYQRRIMASIEAVDGGIVRGWAFDTANPAETLEIQLWDGRRLVTSVPALLPCKDVNETFHTTGNHGFNIVIPERLFDGLDHQLRLTAGGEILTFPADKTPPARLSRALLRNTPGRYVGSVDRVDAIWIEGWAANLQSPFHPVRVALLVDGVCVAIVAANQFQKRLQTVTESGFHAFRYAWPSHLMNGALRAVTARIVEGDVALHFDQSRALDRRVLFPLIDFFAAQDRLSPRSDSLALPLTNIVSRPQIQGGAQAAGKVSVIILNWNGARILERTLKSIARYFTSRAVEVIVVDHGSADNSLAVIEGFNGRLDIRAVARKTNFSFSSSNNLAAGLATGDYLFFVNNDIVFTDDCLPLMADWLDRDAGVGIVGMRLVEPIPDALGGLRYETHHRGVQFQPKVLDNEEVFYGPFELADDFSDIGAAYEMPAVTGAALLCRKADFLAAGGFDDAYFYGMEDVDFCLRLSARLGQRVVCDTSVTAIHNRSFTRTARLVSGKPNPIMANPKSQSQNHRIYSAKFKRQIVHRTLVSLIEGHTSWRPNPLRVTFAVTDVSFSTPAEDFLIAMEMAEALRTQFGWETLFVRHDMHELPGTDVLVAMRPDYDLAKIRHANPGLVTAAWMHGRVDAWLESPHFQSYNLLFCASQLAVRHVAEATGREAFLLPPATNEKRFTPRSPGTEMRTDIVVAGNYLGDDRDAADTLDKANLPGTLAIHGHGWRDHPRWRRYWRGAPPYYDMPDVYAAADLVIVDCRPEARAWDSPSPRVFDALGSGTLVVTKARGAADELFGNLLPTFSTGEELSAQLSYYLEHREEREALVRRLRAEVLEKHTYTARAHAFKDVLRRFAAHSLRFSIKIGVPKHEGRESWGDWHFALGLARALSRAGHHARIDILPDWNCMQGAGDDVVIVLRGLSTYKPVSSKINLLWLISHPDDVPLGELDKYDHVFVASDTYAAVLRRRLGNHVSPLLQCTDPALFHDGDDAPPGVPELLFVGNSRGVRRQAVDDAIQAGLPLGVYGGLWEGIIAPDLVLGTYLANDGLRAYYANAKVVLNDHWPDMKREGFISNRIFDAGACGAAIVSDDVPGMAELFGDAVVTYDGRDDLAGKVADLLADDGRRKALGRRLRETVLAHHTFDHRARDILAVVKLFQ